MATVPPNGRSVRFPDASAAARPRLCLSIWPARPLQVLCLALFAASASAFTVGSARPVVSRSALASKRVAVAGVRMADYKYPSSDTLGIGKNIPSTVYGPLSLVALFIGVTCTAQSNILNILTAESINPLLVMGSTLTLYSFFLHIACYVQQKNGK